LRTFHRRVLLGLILIAAAFLRLYDLNAAPPGLYADEAIDGNNAAEVLETGHPRVFYRENNGREGLYINLAVPFLYLLGNTAEAIRLPAAIAGVLTVWALYGLAAELFPIPVALLAAFFTATSTWHLFNSRLSSRANLAPLFLICALHLLILGSRRARKGLPFERFILAAGVLCGLGFHTYLSYRVAPLLFAAVLIYYASPRSWKVAGIFLGTALVTAAPLLVYFAEHPTAAVARTSQVSVWSEANPLGAIAKNSWETAQMFFLHGDNNWRHNIAGRREVVWPVALAGIAGFIWCLRRIRSSNREEAFASGLVMLWLPVGAIPMVLSNEGIPHAVRSSLMIPPVFILCALGAWETSKRLVGALPRNLLAGIAILAILILCWEPYHSYFEEWARRPEAAGMFGASMVSMAARINRAPRTVPKYVTVNRDDWVDDGIPYIVQPIAYLTGAYTEAGQRSINLHYITPKRFESITGRKLNNSDFCDQVSAALPSAMTFCVDLK
jgi:4-amino-4-deoxy-L-arabinose transferase-like glycosyltransferase